MKKILSKSIAFILLLTLGACMIQLHAYAAANTGTTAETAIFITASNTNIEFTFSGSSSSSGEYKWYSFIPSETTTYTIASNNTTTNIPDPYVYLYNASNTTYALASDDDGGPGYRDFSLSYVLTAGQKYYIKMGAFRAGTDSFSITGGDLYATDITLTEDTTVSDNDTSTTTVSDNDTGSFQWEPTTTEDIFSFSRRSAENVSFKNLRTASGDLTIVNDTQGKLFMDSVNAILGDYTIGYTYNAYINSNIQRDFGGNYTIVMDIPESLRADNRVFKIIAVDQNGIPIAYTDEDSSTDTITFTTPGMYAFAICYTDSIVEKE